MKCNTGAVRYYRCKHITNVNEKEKHSFCGFICLQFICGALVITRKIGDQRIFLTP